MKALVIHSAHDLRIEDRPDPAAPGPGEVRLRIRTGGICGSDLHYFHNGGFGTVRLQEPMILGHEVSGEVIAIGAGVQDLAPGDRVAINPSMPCDECRFCRAGMRNQCENIRFLGSAMRFPHMQGLFRQEINLPAEQAIRLQATTSLAEAACAEPLAVCLHAVKQAGEVSGKRVLVSGCGPIGCLTVVAARHAGADEVVAVDVAAAPLQIARALGAGTAHDLSANPQALAPDADGRGQFDLVFECSGNSRAMATALAVVRPGGTVIAVGLGADVPLPLGTLVTKEVTLRGTFRFDAEFAEAVALIDGGTVDLSPLITASLSMNEHAEAFALASDRSRAMKVQITF
jgi:L-idonate 5-dehydrogenase